MYSFTLIDHISPNQMRGLHGPQRLPFHLVLSQNDSFTVLRPEITANTGTVHPPLQRTTGIRAHSL